MERVARNILTEATNSAKRSLERLNRIYKYNRVEQGDLELDEAVNTLKSILNAQLRTLENIQKQIITGTTQPLYPGDDVIITIDPPEQNPIPCYTKRVFIIKLWNVGQTVWKSRTVNYIQTPKLHPIVTTARQPIPTLNPSDTASIPITIDTRGGEGDFILKCEIWDENDKNCFPNRPDVIEIPVSVRFTP